MRSKPHPICADGGRAAALGGWEIECKPGSTPLLYAPLWARQQRKRAERAGGRTAYGERVGTEKESPASQWRRTDQLDAVAAHGARRVAVHVDA